jgi:hypothetical protein
MQNTEEIRNHLLQGDIEISGRLVDASNALFSGVARIKSALSQSSTNRLQGSARCGILQRVISLLANMPVT